MRDKQGTKRQVINELVKLRQPIAKLEAAEVKLKRAEEEFKKHRERLEELVKKRTKELEDTLRKSEKQASAVIEAARALTFSYDEFLQAEGREKGAGDEQEGEYPDC